MGILEIITLAGGLAFFLYGMNVMSTGLEKMAGGKLEGLLKKLTSSPLKALGLGLGVTAVIQSSSALTVMLVGLVNSGIMHIGQTVCVIMGSNIGTTVTAWLLSLAGLEGSLFIDLLNPKYFSLVLALIGAFMIMMAKSSRKKDVGSIMIGFAVLMYGMKMMGDAVEPLADMPEFTSFMTAFSNPLLGVLAGAVITAVIQSSSASVGILQTLAMTTGAITYGMAIPIIMGQNIGTCISALISSIGTSRNAKKVAVIHITFNLIGTAFWLILYLLIDALVGLAITDQAINGAGIAIVHSIFNISTSILLFPFSKYLVMIANKVLPDKEDKNSVEEQEGIIDKRLLATPSVAIAECNQASMRMAKLAKETVAQSLALLQHYDEAAVQKVIEQEDQLDIYEDKIGTTVVQLSLQAHSEHDSQVTSRVLRAIGDFERLGDHALNFLDIAKEIHEKGIQFTPEAQAELQVLGDAITEVLERTYHVYANTDEAAAIEIEPLEQVIDELTNTIKANHIQRVKKHACTIEMGFILNDLLTNYERISDHCSNIAVSVIETSHSTFDTHRYLHKIKFGNAAFTKNYEAFAEKYQLPVNA